MTDLSNALRPERLEDVIECPAIVRQWESIPQVVLFHGPTGCGKTTLSRILAQTLLSEAGVVRAINASDLSGVDAARELVRESEYQPLTGGNRVVILEECHRMTSDAQNVLLLPLENPQPWSYWFLCTTEPHKMLKTLRDRCVAVEVKELTVKGAAELVNRACKHTGREDAKALVNAALVNNIFHPRGILRMVESSGQYVNDGGSVQAIDVVRAYYQHDAAGVQSLLTQMTAREIVSVSFVAASYGLKVFLANPNPKVGKLITAVTQDLPYDETRAAALLAVRMMTALLSSK